MSASSSAEHDQKEELNKNIYIESTESTRESDQETHSPSALFSLVYYLYQKPFYFFITTICIVSITLVVENSSVIGSSTLGSRKQYNSKWIFGCIVPLSSGMR